ncbi:phage portal protein [Mesorhizobium sp. IMUNJ 23232]|uniref:phage portal protein n=1 Tax=Mesorhizobium sp. IMUNJ 23232 TaxID=3376064 RepID=UPI0037A0F7E6
MASPELLTLFGGVTTVAGVTLGEAGTMRQPTAGSCIRLITNAVSTTPCHLFEKGNDGARARAESHPAERLVSGFANPWTSAGDFKRDMLFRAICEGRSYALASKVRGNVKELIPLPYSAVRRDVDEASGEPSYTLTLKGGGTRRYGYQDILEVAPWGGRSLMRDASEAVGRATIMDTHATRLFKQGKPSGVLRVPGKLTELAAQRISAAWNSSFGGENSGKTAVLEENASWESIALKSVDSQYLETLKLTLEDICRCFSVPPTLVGDLEHSVWKAPEQLAQQFLSFCMLPIFQHIEGAYARCLLTESERNAAFYFEFNLDNFARADLAGRFAAYTQAITSRILSPNEARARENLAPYDGGDVYENPAVSPGQAGATTEGGDDAAQI